MSVKTGKHDRRVFSGVEPPTRRGIGAPRQSHPPPKDPGPMRPKLKTMGYEQRATPKPPGRPLQPSSPELIEIGDAPVGRETMAAIQDDLAREITAYAADEAVTARRVAPRAKLAPAEVFEVVTFVVHGEEIFSKASERSRRDFVKTRLLHRLPVLSMAEVSRIDLSRGADPDSMIMRVWCRIAPPPAG